MRPAVIQIRLSDTEKGSIQKAADYFGESISEFLRRAALMRLKGGKEAKPEDPFLAALRELTKDQVPEKLSNEDKKAIQRARKARKEGTEKLITPDEALDMVREWKNKRR